MSAYKQKGPRRDSRQDSKSNGGKFRIYHTDGNTFSNELPGLYDSQSAAQEAVDQQRAAYPLGRLRIFPIPTIQEWYRQRDENRELRASYVTQFEIVRVITHVVDGVVKTRRNILLSRPAATRYKAIRKLRVLRRQFPDARAIQTTAIDFSDDVTERRLYRRRLAGAGRQQ